MKIGVFDSGAGGRSVANAILLAMPDHEVRYVDDRQNLPYGTKPIEQIHGYVLPILKRLEAGGCDCIVIACNTVTTNLIDQLRAEIKIPLIGIEPMIKPAAEQTISGTIAICATPRTLSSARYAFLKSTYATGLKVLEPDCSQWASLVEDKAINAKHIADTIEPVLEAGADVVVLGCTHYHWIEDDIRKLAAGRAIVIQPESAVVERLKAVIKDLSATKP